MKLIRETNSRTDSLLEWDCPGELWARFACRRICDCVVLTVDTTVYSVAGARLVMIVKLSSQVYF